MSTHYTGGQHVRPRGGADRPTLAILDVIDRTEDHHGIRWDLPAIETARAARTKAAALRAALSAQVDTDRATAAKAGREYVTGMATAEDVVRTATAAAVLAVPETRTAAQRLVEVAAVAAEAEGVDALRTITEAEWLAPLQPVAVAGVARAHTEADALAALVDLPRKPRKGIRDNAHPFAPNEHELNRTPIRHAWERLEESLSALQSVHALPDYLREIGLLPTLPGREYREDYRWRSTTPLVGTPHLVREFWLENRDRAEAGLFTVEQMTADALTAEVEPDDEPAEVEPAEADDTADEQQPATKRRTAKVH